MSRSALKPNHLMVCIPAFHAGNGEYGVMPSAEYDGDSPRSFMNSTPSNPEWTPVTPGRGGNPTQISSAAFITFGYTRRCAVVVVVVEARPFDPLSRSHPPCSSSDLF
jgi:hypothetical protein